VKQSIFLLVLIMLESVPGTNQYYAMRVKFLASWNNEDFDSR